jgi:hypothetical protein
MTEQQAAMEQGAEVAQAGIEAAQAEPTAEAAKPAAKRAVKQTAARVRLPLTEDEADMIATSVVAQIEARGGFDSQPDPVHPPPVAVADPSQAQQAQPQAPVKRTWAERFRSNA